MSEVGDADMGAPRGRHERNDEDSFWVWVSGRDSLPRTTPTPVWVPYLRFRSGRSGRPPGTRVSPGEVRLQVRMSQGCEEIEFVHESGVRGVGPPVGRETLRDPCRKVWDWSSLIGKKFNEFEL